MQPKEEIEQHYDKPDPWGYQNHPEDFIRKQKIVGACNSNIPEGQYKFATSLDVGCGEAWITRDLPAKDKYGFELSHNARRRWPINVRNVDNYPEKTFELVIATGVMYGHYDSMAFIKMLARSTRIVVTCNIKDWEVSAMSDANLLRTVCGIEQIYEEEFAYREYIQKLRVFKKI